DDRGLKRGRFQVSLKHWPALTGWQISPLQGRIPMTGLAVALVLSSAVLHATWNLFAKRVSGGVGFVWLMTTLQSLIYLPLALYILVVDQPPLTPMHLVFVLGSGVLHIGYFTLLGKGYQKGDLSLVYPLARGTGPMLSTTAAILLLGERPTPLALVGAACIGI